jgi:hypothetical protein
VALPHKYVEQLKFLSAELNEPMAHYFREALRDLFAKHAAVLRTMSPEKTRAQKRDLCLNGRDECLLMGPSGAIRRAWGPLAVPMCARVHT